MATLYIHGHLIVDDYRQYLDGSLLIDDDHIIDIYPELTNVNDKDTKIIDLKGQYVFPAFFDTNKLFDYQIVVDPLDDKKINTSKKIMLGNTLAYLDDINIEYDGYYDLFNKMTGFDPYKKGLVNGAFNDDRYVEIDSSHDESILKVVYKLKRKDRIILIGDIKQGIKKMYHIGADFNELLLMSSLNAYRLFGLDHKNGSLIKGKNANIEIMGDFNV